MAAPAPPNPLTDPAHIKAREPALQQIAQAFTQLPPDLLINAGRIIGHANPEALPGDLKGFLLGQVSIEMAEYAVDGKELLPVSLARSMGTFSVTAKLHALPYAQFGELLDQYLAPLISIIMPAPNHDHTKYHMQQHMFADSKLLNPLPSLRAYTPNYAQVTAAGLRPQVAPATHGPRVEPRVEPVAHGPRAPPRTYPKRSTHSIQDGPTTLAELTFLFAHLPEPVIHAILEMENCRTASSTSASRWASQTLT